MSTARERAYAALRAGAPVPARAADTVEAFGERFRAQGGNWARLGSWQEIPAWLEARFAPGDGGTLALVTAADERLDALPWGDAPGLQRYAPARPPQASLALTVAFGGVAETGALLVHPRPGAPMALNFLPDRLVIVVSAADVVAVLEDVWERARRQFGDRLPRGFCFVAGPSSSGDVEMTFATGVHGPIEVHALVVP